METTYIFKRIEKKYLLTHEKYEKFFDKIRTYMTPDKFGKSTVCSIYLDTPDYLIIRNSIEADNYKEKLRLRSYGTPKSDSTVYLELKKKFDGVVYKRRIAMTLKEAEDYLNFGIKPTDSQVMKEIDYSMKYYNNPKPAALISCEREAWYSTEQSDLRITFDSAIRYRTSSLHLDRGSSGIELIPAGSVLMEIKTAGAMPLWLSHSLNELNILPTSFSKYGTAYKECLLKSKIQVDQNNKTYRKGEIKNVINL